MLGLVGVVKDHYSGHGLDGVRWKDVAEAHRIGARAV